MLKNLKICTVVKLKLYAISLCDCETFKVLESDEPFCHYNKCAYTALLCDCQCLFLNSPFLQLYYCTANSTVYFSTVAVNRLTLASWQEPKCIIMALEGHYPIQHRCKEKAFSFARSKYHMPDYFSLVFMR